MKSQTQLLDDCIHSVGHCVRPAVYSFLGLAAVGSSPRIVIVQMLSGCQPHGTPAYTELTPDCVKRGMDMG